jgi:hypothetical protein
MRWEMKHKVTPEPGDIRFVTKFAWWPTIVLNKLTMTDHRIWLELYIEEQEYVRSVHHKDIVSEWLTVSKTIHT